MDAKGERPLVSVIMPAYNAEKYIEEAIRSVLSQTYTNWKLLILDDGSTDRTAELAERFANADTRIRLLRNPQNMGVARTRNRGFDMANGDWAALLDSDDVWHSDKLEKQLAAAERSGADGCLLQRLFGENDGLALAVRGCHLFDRKRLADSVVDMALAHGARHAVDFQSGLIHENASLAAH